MRFSNEADDVQAADKAVDQWEGRRETLTCRMDGETPDEDEDVTPGDERLVFILGLREKYLKFCDG